MDQTQGLLDFTTTYQATFQVCSTILRFVPKTIHQGIHTNGPGHPAAFNHHVMHSY